MEIWKYGNAIINFILALFVRQYLARNVTGYTRYSKIKKHCSGALRASISCTKHDRTIHILFKYYIQKYYLPFTDPLPFYELNLYISAVSQILSENTHFINVIFIID